MGKQVKSAADMSGGWVRSMQSSTTSDNYVKGINRTNVNPMALAASDDATQLYLNRVQESVRSGKRQKKLMDANPAVWKTNATTVGKDRLSNGATKAKPKVDAHFALWQPRYQQISDTVNSMPKGTRAAAKDRVAKAIDMAMDFAGRS